MVYLKHDIYSRDTFWSETLEIQRKVQTRTADLKTTYGSFVLLFALLYKHFVYIQVIFFQKAVWRLVKNHMNIG